MKTVIEMAREAGLITNSFGDVHGDIYHLERFAAQVREDERENQQEPVARVVDCDMLGTPIIGMVDSSLQIGDKLYTTPPTAALAARQMRDAAVKVCDEINRYTQHQSKEAYSCALALSQTIAALPMPDVQWRDLTDDDYAWLLKNNRIFDFQARAVIAKFKEKQL